MKKIILPVVLLLAALFFTSCDGNGGTTYPAVTADEATEALTVLYTATDAIDTDFASSGVGWSYSETVSLTSGTSKLVLDNFAIAGTDSYDSVSGEITESWTSDSESYEAVLNLTGSGSVVVVTIAFVTIADNDVSLIIEVNGHDMTADLESLYSAL